MVLHFDQTKKFPLGKALFLFQNPSLPPTSLIEGGILDSLLPVRIRMFMSRIHWSRRSRLGTNFYSKNVHRGYNEISVRPCQQPFKMAKTLRNVKPLRVQNPSKVMDC